MDKCSVKEKIIKLRRDGKSYKVIRGILNCSSGYISEVCKSVGLNNIGLDQSKKLNKDEIYKMNIFYITHTIEETALEFGVSRTTVIKNTDNKRKELTKDERNIINYQRVKSFRKKTKERSVEYKGGMCIVCGYNKCISALDFHHLNPNDKSFSISGNCNRSWDKIKTELDKCVILCANCHREVHDGLIKI
jgi:hypothetical protein